MEMLFFFVVIKVLIDLYTELEFMLSFIILVKTYLTVRKRRKNERKILSVKNEYVEPFKHATTHQLE